MRKQTFDQITQLTAKLIELSLCDDQRFPSQRNAGGLIEIVPSGAPPISFALRDVPYPDLYREMERQRVFNVRLIDGALMQLSYLFAGDHLVKHRLAFFPSPHLDTFESDPRLYLEDELFADIVAARYVPVPFRFDFDEDTFTDLDHPKSHFTIGQTTNCRIPVLAPLTPAKFTHFVLRNFYFTAFKKYEAHWPSSGQSFADSITKSEREIVHVAFA